MKLKQKPKRTRQISTRISPEDYRAARVLLKAKGYTWTEFINQCVARLLQFKFHDQ